MWLLALTGCLINADLHDQRADALMDADQDGFLFQDDCDDEDPAINPDAAEVCDGVDNNCDGTIDVDATDALDWYTDLDGDGYGTGETMGYGCEGAEGQSPADGDCNDADASVHPDADEWCDDLDHDCDGLFNEPNALDAQAWYRDGDLDGYGSPDQVELACAAPEGYADNDLDCDDHDATQPTTWYPDADGDGYGRDAAGLLTCDPADSYTRTSGDCDDADPQTYPGALERLDGEDSDCDGRGDLDDPDVMRRVPKGTFTMGSQTDEVGRFASENAHQVVLTHDVWISSTPVTQAFYEQVMGVNPSGYGACPTCPVDQVSWTDAALFMNQLSTDAGLPTCYACSVTGGITLCVPGLARYDCEGYRLPYEAEWEKAARAGTSTALHQGSLPAGAQGECVQRIALTGGSVMLDEVARYCYDGSPQPQPVATLRPNALGLYDMAGNVFEWTNDAWTFTLGDETDPRVWALNPDITIKGGSTRSEPKECRHAWRNSIPHAEPREDLGFRVALTAD
ncbi:MAG: SUMF1/EgtB/PvdO family nonheme iron enzyme [Deltaproteobacteria bacterium]|nr:SUMF1/EgtB/PvdO family nonheme iron enzyme [Deltaproteobacteria bacterium]